jgi:hypothetical protein
MDFKMVWKLIEIQVKKNPNNYKDYKTKDWCEMTYNIMKLDNEN